MARRDASWIGSRFESLSYDGLLVAWFLNVVIFAFVYWVLNHVPGHGVIEPLQNGPAILRWYDALYFSVITGTTLGYGDIIPIGVSRFFAAFQSFASFVLLALTVARMSSRRTEQALNEIHKLTREVKELVTNEKVLTSRVEEIFPG